MRATVPTSLQGGSLLDAHKWVKSKVARSNPGGSPDYKLADSKGNPLTLSDLISRNPGGEVTVEIISGRGGVRNNPSLPLPTDFTPSPNFARAGNFSNQLLPKDLDPALVERMVAQEGIFGAVNTLTILLSKRSTADGISPTTAGLLYAHSAIPRQNPGGKTPFLADAPKEMHDSEIMIHRYLNDNNIADIEKQSIAIGQSKISAKYDLTLARLEQFVKEVLAPFLAVASANRGAVRAVNKISAGFDSEEKKDFANKFGKLMYLLPTKAEDFYAGREYGLVATTEFIYPILAQRLLSSKEVDTLLGVASRFPNNLDSTGKQLKLSGKEMKLIKNRTAPRYWKSVLAQVPFISKLVPSIAVKGESQHAKGQIVSGKIPSDNQLISYIVDSINLEKYSDGGLKEVVPSKFLFMKNIGGYYPSPPKGWPPMLMYAIMDALLESLPEIVDIRNTDDEDRFTSKVNFNITSTIADDTVFVPDDTEVHKQFSYKEYKSAVIGTDPDREKLLKDIGITDPALITSLKGDVDGFTKHIFENWKQAGRTTMNTSADLGKSVIELLYDALEIARGKYGYEPSNDDITFVLLMLDYSIKTLFDSGATATAFSASLSSIFGGKKVRDTTKRFSEFTEAVDKKTVLLGGGNEAAIAYLTGASALMSLYIEQAQAGSNKAVIVKAERYLAELDASSIDATIKGYAKTIVKDAIKTIKAL